MAMLLVLVALYLFISGYTKLQNSSREKYDEDKLSSAATRLILGLMISICAFLIFIGGIYFDDVVIK